jgi:hypothetical protein
VVVANALAYYDRATITAVKKFYSKDPRLFALHTHTHTLSLSLSHAHAHTHTH